MTDNSRAFLLISCGVILVSISSLSLVTSQNGAHDCSAAIAAPASSPLQAAQEYRDRAFDQLKEAEKKKTEEPERYSEALTQMASQAANYEMISKGLKNESDSQEGNKYFKLAIDFYCANKWGIKESDDVARTLWTASSGRSTAALEAVFERLFKASERHLTDDSDTHGRDLALWVALCQRQESMPLNDQKRLVERAIAIRKSALKSNRSRLLAPLYDNLAYCFGEAHDIKGAEASYITAVSMLDSDPVQQEHALVELAKFYVNNQMFAQADATWKRAAKLTIARRLVWYTSGYVDLIHLFKYQQQWSYTGPIFDTLLTHGDDFDFHLLDPELVEYVERRIKSGDLATAADLVKKRIAAAPGQGKRPGMEDWKIRLSNIYLAQGRTTESKALFDQVIADSVRLSLPTADWKNERARLMENLGLHDAAQKLSASTAASSSDIVLPSSLVVKGNIEFGPGSQVTSFDSSDHNDPALKGISGCYMRTIPPEGDGSILCLGNVTGESLQYAGTIYCRSSKVTSDRASHPDT
jgi:tetratricopeptide (TPR) repeat protein